MLIPADILQTGRLLLSRAERSADSDATLPPKQSWTIAARDSESVVGTLTVHESDLWLEIKPEFRRQGFGLEAMNLLTAQQATPHRVRTRLEGSVGKFLIKCGYSEVEPGIEYIGPTRQQTERRWQRQLASDQIQYQNNVRAIHQALQLPLTYGADHNLGPVAEANSLKNIGRDIYDRPQHLTVPAAAAWHDLQNEARKQGVTLNPVSSTLR